MLNMLKLRLSHIKWYTPHSHSKDMAELRFEPQWLGIHCAMPNVKCGNPKLNNVG